MYGNKEILAVYGYNNKEYAIDYLYEGAGTAISDIYYDSDKLYCEMYYNFSDYVLGVDNVYIDENTKRTYITEKFIPTDIILYISSDEDMLFDIEDEDFGNLGSDFSFACLKIDAEDMYNLSVDTDGFNTLKND